MTDVSNHTKFLNQKKRFAISLDNEKYIVSYSEKYIEPGNVIVDSIPDESDPRKLNCYQYIDNEYVFDNKKWDAIEAERQKNATEQAKTKAKEVIEDNIAEFKKALEATDYKIIKCFEYSLLNLDLPYDVKSLHTERQAIRDKINAIIEKQ